MGAQTDFIRNNILELILLGELKPGHAISETDICKRFKSSRTPFREAVLQLEAMDIVERRPRAGAFVKYPGFRELVERIEFHAELEGTASAMAARRANKSQRQALKRINKQYQKVANQADSSNNSGIYEINLQFHQHIFRSAANPPLHQQIELSGYILVAFFRARHDVLSHIKKSASEHMQMLDAILDCDSQKARELTYSHVIMNAEELLDISNSFHH